MEQPEALFDIYFTKNMEFMFQGCFHLVFDVLFLQQVLSLILSQMWPEIKLSRVLGGI